MRTSSASSIESVCSFSQKRRAKARPLAPSALRRFESSRSADDRFEQAVRIFGWDQQPRIRLFQHPRDFAARTALTRLSGAPTTSA